MAKLPRLAEHVAGFAKMSLDEALAAAAQKLTIERGAPASEAALDAAEKALGVRFPKDYRAFMQAQNGLRAVGDPAFGFGSLEVYPLERIEPMRAFMERYLAGRADLPIAPLLVPGDEVEQGAYCAAADGELHYTHAKDGETERAGSFDAALLEALGQVIIVDEAKSAGAKGRFCVAIFERDEDVAAVEELLDEADAGDGILDFVDAKDGKKLEYLTLGRQILVAHPAAKRWDEARFEATCREKGATAFVSHAGPARIVIRSKTNRGVDALDRAFSEVARDFTRKNVVFDGHEPSGRTRVPTRYVFAFDSKTSGRAIGLAEGDGVCEEIVGALLALLRNKGAKDWELSFRASASAQ